MAIRDHKWWIAFPFVCAFLSAQSMQVNVTKSNLRVLKAAVDRSTTLRLFYQPLKADFLHPPLVFKVADEKDPKLNTAPITDVGRLVYISATEMRSLVDRMISLHLIWQGSLQQEPLLPAWKMPASNELQITVMNSDGTAKANIVDTQVCKHLKKLNSTLKQPRALWELERFQANYLCIIPGFNPGAYPDHY